MVITRKSTTYDIEHGGNYNNEFIDKGVTFYTQEEGTNHSDKMENDETFWFDKKEVDEDEWDSKKLHVKNVHVHNDQEIDNDLTVDGNTHLIGIPGDDNDPALVVDNNTVLKGQTEEDEEGNISYVGNALTVGGKSKFEEDVQMDRKLHVDGETTIDNNLYVNGTATVTGDLYVKGTSYEEHSTDLYVGSDFVTLREGSETGLADGERAGIVINKYDGTDSLGIVTDPHGTLRIGEFNTVKVYTKDDTTFYSDRELTNEITLPDDTKLYQVGEEDPDTGLKEYYYIAKDDTEPVATRGNSDDMEDDYVTVWDADGEDIVTSNTNQTRVIDTEVRSKNLEARVQDIEAGKLNIDASSKYPVVIDETPDELYKVTNTIAPYLTRVDKRVEGDGSVDIEFTYYQSDRVFYVSNEDPDSPSYTEVVDYRSYTQDDSLIFEYYTEDDGWQSFDHLYYRVGNEESNNYNVSLTPDNVIRYFESVDAFNEEKEATEDGTSSNPLEPDNVVMIKNTFSLTDDVQTDIELPTGAPLTIVDYVQTGNYNAITSNAVQRAIGNVGEAMADNVTIKVTNPTYAPIDTDAALLYINNYDSTGNILEGHTVYFEDNDVYYASTSALDNGDNTYTFNFGPGLSITGNAGYPITHYTITEAGKMYAVIDTQLNKTSALPVQNRVITNELEDHDNRITEIRDMLPDDLEPDEKILTTTTAFNVIYPVNSVYLSLDSNPPEIGTWTLLTKLDGPINSDTNVHIWKRLS